MLPPNHALNFLSGLMDYELNSNSFGLDQYQQLIQVLSQLAYADAQPKQNRSNLTLTYSLLEKIVNSASDSEVLAIAYCTLAKLELNHGKLKAATWYLDEGFRYFSITYPQAPTNSASLHLTNHNELWALFSLLEWINLEPFCKRSVNYRYS